MNEAPRFRVLVAMGAGRESRIGTRWLNIENYQGPCLCLEQGFLGVYHIIQNKQTNKHKQMKVSHT